MNNQRDGRYFDKTVYRYHRQGDYFECPAGERLPKKTRSLKNRSDLYTTTACTDCAIKE